MNNRNIKPDFGNAAFGKRNQLLFHFVVIQKGIFISKLPLMQGRKAALVTMSYLGAVRTVPNYNVMGVAKASLEASVRYIADSLGPEGIRVNGISAGPIRTLAASGIKDFKNMLDEAEQKNPLRRNVTIQDVGNATAFLCSDLASGITGDILYVDSGYHIVGMV